jgi:transglutaminase-like putative cysteine protease
MSRLRIRHETTYTYAAPVTFGPWRLLMRPADTHSVRVLEASFELFPMGGTRWTYDAYSNSVCHFTPQGPSDRLTVVNNLLIERYPAPLSPLNMDDPRSLSPIVYDAAARTALAPFIMPATDDIDAAYHEWLRAHANQVDEPALDYVMRLNRSIHQDFRYATRTEYGTQTPATTVGAGVGTCRDFAWLMIESLRHLGFAARFVTGYIYAGQNVGAGATHAWCEVFLPDLGWIECDPTNGLVESDDLIRVASTRTPQEASPMEGVVLDDPGGSSMTVTVDVHQDSPQASWTF